MNSMNHQMSVSDLNMKELQAWIKERGCTPESYVAHWIMSEELRMFCQDNDITILMEVSPKKIKKMGRLDDVQDLSKKYRVSVPELIKGYLEQRQIKVINESEQHISLHLNKSELEYMDTMYFIY